jgi:hypothetical protein
MGETCKVTISFVPHAAPHEDHPQTVWTLDSIDPLTISPDIECKADGCAMKGRLVDGGLEEDD